MSVLECHFRLFYDTNSDVWILALVYDFGINATTKVTAGYPLGTHLWQLKTPAFTRSVEMNLNSCDDSQNYNCRDGSCIDIAVRLILMFDEGCKQLVCIHFDYTYL
jgi:hypothetical protein